MACACDGKQFLPFRRFGSPTPPSPTASEDTRGVIPKFKTEVRQGEVLFNDPILLEFRQLGNISYFATLQLTQKSLCCVAESMSPPNTSKNNSVARAIDDSLLRSEGFSVDVALAADVAVGKKEQEQFCRSLLYGRLSTSYSRAI